MRCPDGFVHLTIAFACATNVIEHSIPVPSSPLVEGSGGGSYQEFNVVMLSYVQAHCVVQWNLSNPDILGTEAVQFDHVTIMRITRGMRESGPAN